MAAKRILFLCTGNSARSILAEALLNRLGGGRVEAFSAGSRPAGSVHPGALRLLTRAGYQTAGLRSKSWQEFAGPEASPMDAVITVCGNAAGEACPVFPGRFVRAHWGLPDPAAVEGDEAALDHAFEGTCRLLRERIECFLALPFETMANADLQAELNRIGTLEGAA